jgi:glycosyltransferase involved in cell wall biosynthesis
VKVSVIICALDKKKILPETIPSIKRSPLVDELIIVEGLRPIGYSRDVGWRRARNEFIYFIDDDEAVPDGWIERLAKEFEDEKVGAVWSTLKPLNPNKINELESTLQNHVLKKFGRNARFVRKKALEDIGGYEHTIGGETVNAAIKMIKCGWKTKIVDYPFFHMMAKNNDAWIMQIYQSTKICAFEILEHKELLSYSKRAVGGVLRGMHLSALYKEPLFLVFYPLRCWLLFFGLIHRVAFRSSVGCLKRDVEKYNPKVCRKLSETYQKKLRR